jgi:surfeit locus 1 family protein
MLSRLRSAGLIWPTLLAAPALALLVSLGNWQMARKDWKDALIASLAARASADPITLTAALDRLARTGEVEYVRASARGRFNHDKERHVWAPDPKLGPGFHVYTPLALSSPQGLILMVNRGYVPERLKEPQTREAGNPRGEVEVTGLLRAPPPAGFFTPRADAHRNLFYARDLEAMLASAFGGTAPPHVPLFLDADPAPQAAPPGPRGGATETKIPNRHLEYALTWYGLAATLLAVYLAFARARLREARPA